MGVQVHIELIVHHLGLHTLWHAAHTEGVDAAHRAAAVREFRVRAVHAQRMGVRRACAA